jgi:hypothetical protein
MPESTSITDIVNTTGNVVYSNAIFARYTVGKGRRWCIVFFSGLGALITLGWLILSIFATLNSKSGFPMTTMFAANFTGFIIGIISVYIILLVLVVSIKNTTIKIKTGRMGQEMERNAWQCVAVENRRRVKFSFVLQTICIFGLIFCDIAFLSARLQPFMTYFSNIMYDVNGLITTDTILQTSTDTCDVSVVTKCNAGATYIMHDIIAQSFVNSNHVNIILLFVLYIAFLFELLAFAWLEVTYIKHPGEDPLIAKIVDSGYRPLIRGRQDAGEDEEDGGSEPGYVDISPKTKTGSVWFFIPQTETKTNKSTGVKRIGAANDPMLAALKITIIIGISTLGIMWLFQMLTVIGVYDSRCSWFDDYGGFWLVFISLYWTVTVVIGLITMGINLKDVVVADTTNMQRFKILFMALYLVLHGVLLVVLGGIWIAEHGNTNFTIPDIILCRTHPYWRTYNALKVYEISTFIITVFIFIDYYFFHTSNVGRIELLRSFSDGTRKDM